MQRKSKRTKKTQIIPPITKSSSSISKKKKEKNLNQIKLTI